MWLAMHEPEKAQELLGREKGYVPFEEIEMYKSKEEVLSEIDYRILKNAEKYSEKKDDKLKDLLVLYALLKAKVKNLDISELTNAEVSYDFEEDNDSLKLVTISFREPSDFLGMCDPTSYSTNEEICEVNINT